MTRTLALLSRYKKIFFFLEGSQYRKFSHYSNAVLKMMEQHDRIRENPVICKLDTPEFKSIFTDEVLHLKSLFDKYGYEIRLAGGPVRDLLMGIQPKDLDFATVATPTQMKEMFTKEEVRLINVNGEKHGTITPRIHDKENFEITTLRIDVVTDGRHAEVEYTSDWKLDANRRDLTINSMFLGFDGSVYDYFYGYEDLKAKRIAFVGDADVRIKEDYLRIMRYFRFYGRVSTNSNNHETDTLQCIKDNAHGLQRISGERIWSELKKTLSGKFGGDLLKTMLDLELGKYIGLPEKPNLDELDAVWKSTHGKYLQPICLLSTLLNDVDDVINLNNRLKFSTFDRDLAYFIVEHRAPKISDKPLLPYQKLLLNAKIKQPIAREYIIELLKYTNNTQLLEEFKNWEMPKFHRITIPLLNKNGVTVPRIYAYVINGLRDYWADHDFNLSLEELEKQIPTIAEKVEHMGMMKKKANN